MFSLNGGREREKTHISRDKIKQTQTWKTERALPIGSEDLERKGQSERQ